ncbi:hypothetical protein OOZ19_20090 [Saccharopolyspora sp. NFXS83]|uniref:hypothetical protein n=1 Tax=Saccharopolyspora sp. NFXS83 TaxID=2993560 RepID=UPI00224B37C1|nr:hypothetical protein [Saccharopolyspora sp. NFXS83]MCX2732545.1 hypothetical protein [Saccharopolyspora sp. NFXS83]
MGRERLAQGHRMFQVIYRKWFEVTVNTPPAVLPDHEREKLDRALDIATWMDVYRPQIRVP